MTIYIPVLPILWGLFVYVMIGLFMVPVFVKWQTRFISNWQERSMWEGVHIVRAFLVTPFIWPVMLFFTAKTEIDYRRKGYL